MKVEFHVLNDAQGLKSLFFACQLIETMYQNNEERIYIHVNSREEADRLDSLLWTYRDDSFLPHHVYESPSAIDAPIQIGFGEAPNHFQTVMINLNREIPSFYKQFNHVIEIVFSDPLVQQLARERYKRYREDGCEILTHKQR